MLVGREKEMEMLPRTSDALHPQFVRIQGRRRIGVSKLLLHELAEREGFFFDVDEADRTILLHALGEQLVLL